MKLKLDLYYVNTNSYTKFRINIPKNCREKSGKLILAKGNNSSKSKSSVTKLKLDLYIFTKGNNSYESKSSVMKLNLNLYYVNANSYTKFQVNISKDCREKSEKLNFSKGQ